jgi:D-alanyl-D-alanine carboxypeptidase/D-alanyl-D-alanine-endopeptidase (penicillin-binding protein 4)
MRNFYLLLFISIWFSCSPVSKRALSKKFKATETAFQDHTGFFLLDPSTKEVLCNYNGDKYFTPASNTKIFTLYAGLTLLGDSVPTLRYSINGDSLIFWGTGDPSFLYKEVYNNNRVFSFLKTAPYSLFFSDANFKTTHFGPGWAWDDYNDYYAAERSPFPVYGNLVSVSATREKLNVEPLYFSSYFKIGTAEEKAKAIRRIESNEFLYHPSFSAKVFQADVPFTTDPELTTHLLTDTLNKMVRHIQKPFIKNAITFFSIPVDSLYKVMMQESDNLIAEQLLLMCSQAVSDTLQPEIAITYMKKNFLQDLSDEPKWVDGSGLSRYNLFTPRSIGQLWQKIYQIVPQERLLSLLATGGKSGTIKNWYKAETPYIFGKTGSLSNNHCLSGFIVTKKGKTLIFSFMNNNFTSSVNDIRLNMEKILKLIYEKY